MIVSITNAITAHMDWIHELGKALARRDVSPVMKHAGYDDMCEFGKWLYSLEDSVKITPHFRRVKDLHYRFHQEAELVVNAAVGGDFDEARLLTNGQLFRTSEDLIAAMEAWKNQL